jgi:hypothetical protein
MTVSDKPMTAKSLIRKALAAKSATAFFAAYREFLLTGELTDITSPILAKIDANELLPTPGLKQITDAVFQHILAKDLEKAKCSLTKVAKVRESKEQKPFVASIRNDDGEVMVHVTEDGEEKELIASFNFPQDAERWVDRKLFAGAPDWHGEILWTKCPDKLEPLTVIDRVESMSRTLVSGRSTPILHKTKKTTSRLGFGVKVSNHVSRFSHG